MGVTERWASSVLASLPLAPARASSYLREACKTLACPGGEVCIEPGSIPRLELPGADISCILRLWPDTLHLALGKVEGGEFVGMSRSWSWSGKHDTLGEADGTLPDRIGRVFASCCAAVGVQSTDYSALFLGWNLSSGPSLVKAAEQAFGARCEEITDDEGKCLGVKIKAGVHFLSIQGGAFRAVVCDNQGQPRVTESWSRSSLVSEDRVDLPEAARLADALCRLELLGSSFLRGALVAASGLAGAHSEAASSILRSFGVTSVEELDEVKLEPHDRSRLLSILGDWR